MEPWLWHLSSGSSLLFRERHRGAEWGEDAHRGHGSPLASQPPNGACFPFPGWVLPLPRVLSVDHALCPGKARPHTLSYQWNFCCPEFLLGWAETSMGGETGSEDENSVTSKIPLVCSGQGGLLKRWWGATPGPPTERAGQPPGYLPQGRP